MSDAPESARDALADAVSLWRLDPKAAAADVVDAATQALVDGLDTPSLRILAGVSPKSLTSDLMPLVEETMAELGLSAIVEGDPQRTAMAVMLRRLKAGRLGPRELTTWAFVHIGHESDAGCSAFVTLDDRYDLADDFDYDVAVLDQWVHDEADAFLAERPSPGRAGGWWPPRAGR